MTTKSPLQMTLREFWTTYVPKSNLRAPDTVRFRWNAIERNAPDNPPIGEITDQWLEQLRDNAEANGLSAATIRAMLKLAMKTLRHAGPRGHWSAGAIGLIDVVPYCECPRDKTISVPRRIPLEELSRVYIAAKQMTVPPRKGIAPAELWRTALVLSYATGLRRSDLMNLQWSQVDFADSSLHFVAKKTGKRSIHPLPKYALEHLKRLKANDIGTLIFRGWGRTTGSRHYNQLRHWCELAGVEPFGWHDVRRTAASEIERVRFGMASLLLQHSSKSVTEKFYLDCQPELRDAVEKMRVPIGFNAGCRMYERVEATKQKEAAKLSPHDFDVSIKPNLADWQFSALGFAFRGQWFSLPTKKHL
ncbi:MAG: tyrosine-type recombinase/integrase, partial [Planctomycetales bacterium]|nr:tyrosine-type recombinase/integrase [Planctomycetales bacterium]